VTGPIYVDWAITTRCNLDCLHCVGMEEGETSHEEAIKIAREIIALKPRWIILEGGEPLMRPDLTEIGTMFRDAGIEVFLITNGNAFTEEKLRELVSYSPKILFSIDGATQEVYEYTKRGASFDVAREWARKCADAGIFHGITTVLSKTNLGQMGDLIKLTEDLGGERVIFLPLKPFGEGEITKSYYEEQLLSPQEHEDAIKEVYGSGTSLDIFYDEPFLWNLSRKHGFSLEEDDSGVTIPDIEGCAAAYSLYIQTSGSVRPCMFCQEDLNFGNATREPLAEIWERMRNSATITGWFDQSLRKGTCGECPQFSSCGGCLARTLKLTGDLLEADPSCPLAVKLAQVD